MKKFFKAIAVSLVASAAFATNTLGADYSIYIGSQSVGTQFSDNCLTINKDNCSFITSGSATFNPSTSTLTLSSLKVDAGTSDCFALWINNRAAITVALEGENTLTNSANYATFQANADVTLSGSGSLAVVNTTDNGRAFNAWSLAYDGFTLEDGNILKDGCIYNSDGTIVSPTATFKSAATSINNPSANSTEAYATDNAIVLNVPSSVFSISGNLVYKGSKTILSATPGIYVVKTASGNKKVIVK